MSERTLEQYFADQPVHWHQESGNPVKAIVERTSLTGKRIKIRYLMHPSWTGGQERWRSTYVKATSLSHRDE